MRDFGGGLASDLPARIREAPFAEFLRMPNCFFPPTRGWSEWDINRARYWAAHADQWISRKGTIRVGFEALRERYPDRFRALVASLDWQHSLLSDVRVPPLHPTAGTTGLGIGLQRIRRAVMKRWWRATRGLRTPPPSSAYARRGIPGDWRAHFSPDDLGFFMQHAGETMQRLGYPAS
jgi:hypothetical protein